MPFQGGTNEEVVFYLFKTLSQEAAKNLHVYWYVGKDQCIPLNAVHKTRNCHGRFLFRSRLPGRADQSMFYCLFSQIFLCGWTYRDPRKWESRFAKLVPFSGEYLISE